MKRNLCDNCSELTELPSWRDNMRRTELLARMAATIAGGCPLSSAQAEGELRRLIAESAVDIARRILAECEK